MIGKLQLGAGSGGGLKGRRHLDKRVRTVGLSFGVGQPLFGGFEFPLGGASARADLPAAREGARGVGAEMAGHPGEVVVVGAAETQRPRKCRGGRLGQVVQEAQTRLFGGVLIVKSLDSVAASFDLQTQPRGFLPQGIGAVATVHLDVQQGQIPPAGGDANRVRIHGCRQVADHYRPQPGLQVHHAATLHAGAVLEDGHARDRCVQASALRHRSLPFLPANSIVSLFVPPVSAHRSAASQWCAAR